MKRISMEALEALSFAKRRAIEIDATQGIAVCTVGGTVYYATLTTAETVCEPATAGGAV